MRDTADPHLVSGVPCPDPETGAPVARRSRWRRRLRENWLHLILLPLAVLWLSPLF